MPASSTADRRTLIRVPVDHEELRAAVEPADVPVAEVGPTGSESLAPLVTATSEGRTAFYPQCSPDQASDVAAALASGEIAERGAAAVSTHPPDAMALPRPGLGGLDVGDRRVLAGAGWRRPADADDHAASGGFASPTVDEIRDVADDIAGRGWGDFRHDQPVGAAWRMLSEDGDAPTVVVNAHGRGADAVLCASVPFEVLEGACHVARAVDGGEIVVYLPASDKLAAEQVREAAAAYPDPPAPIDVATGPDVHRAAEPTMALEAIEGNHRLEARLTPPGSVPTLHDTPALVHTARTVAQLAITLRTGDGPTTRIVTVSGDVDAPATVELPTDATLARALDAVEVTDGFKAACVGGRFGGLTDTLDVAPTPAALTEADLGTEGTIEVLGRDECILSFAGRRTRAAAETNCGRCVPCREGSTQLTELLRDVYDGDLDRDGIAELARTMAGASLCEFGVNAGRPARTAVTAFDDEVSAHADGRCPTGTCPEVT